VLSALVTLAIEGHLPWWPVVHHRRPRGRACRSTASWAGRRGVSIPARNSAKLKTFVQDLAVGDLPRSRHWSTTTGWRSS
jgi:hypothetical protein